MTNVNLIIDRFIERSIDWDAFWDLGSDVFSRSAREEIERIVNGGVWDQVVDELHNMVRINSMFYIKGSSSAIR